MNQSAPEKFSPRTWGARLVLLGLLVLVGVQLGAQSKEKEIRVINNSEFEIAQVEIRWTGGNAGWKRLSSGQQVETVARIGSPTSVEFSFRDGRGVPHNYVRKEALDPNREGTLQIRLTRDRQVYWLVPDGTSGSK